MTTTESSRVKYEISYDKTKQLVLVYPQWRGTRPNAHVIGEYTPENAQASVEDYREELGEAIQHALGTVGETDIEPWEIRVTPLDGSKDFVAKEAQGPLKRVALEDQVPVSGNVTAAQAAQTEEQNGEPIPHASQKSKELAKEGIDETTPRMRDEKPPATKKAAKKTARKSSDE